MPHPGDILSAGYLPYNYPGWIRVHCGKPEIPPNPIQDVGVTYGNYSNQQVTIRLDVQILGSTSLLKISGAYEITVEPQSVANIGFGFDYVRMVILNSCLTALGTIRLLVIDTSNNNILAKCNINSTVVTPIESQLELINPIIAPLLSYLNTLKIGRAHV